MADRAPVIHSGPQALWDAHFFRGHCMKTYRLLGILAAAATAAAPAIAHAQLGTMSYQYFSVANSSANHDFQQQIDGNIVHGLVNTALGPNGLPIVSAYGMSNYGASGPITQYSASTKELQWFTPGAGITADGTGTVAVPFTGMDHRFFPTSQTSNANFFRTAIFSGMISVAGPATYNFSLGSDDDAWLFIDGNLVGDNGGIKSGSPTVFDTGSLTAGNHSVSLFFADRHVTESGITFTPEFTVTTTPEPASMSLVATGLVGVFGMVRRRRKSIA